MNQIWQA